ncbi:MAG TPA: DPP IV N-terminal domain-containing protein [Gaiellaceae bacterium]|nr:DPP IV N-terminal domain-containing protein [Gaiellaceae bacterium]
MSAEPTAAATDLAARYARAEALLPQNVRALVDAPRVVPNWIRGGERFWYRRTTSAGSEFVLVDPEARTKAPAFDHARLAAGLGEVLEREVDPFALPFAAIELRDGAVRFAVEETEFEVSLDTYAATAVGPVRHGESLSPDGRWAVGFEGYDLYVRDTETDEVRRLTTDAEEAYEYARGTDPVKSLVMLENFGAAHTVAPYVVWSPDSTRFATHRIDQRNVELMHLVRSSPFDGGRPRLLSYRYALVGEPDEKLATAQHFVFDAASGERVEAQWPPIQMSFVPVMLYGWLWWSDDGTKVYWISGDRGDRTMQLHELDAASGAVRVVLEERSETKIIYGPYHHECNVRTLASGEVLLWSQRTDWGHLYLYDADGNARALTEGEWVVHRLVSLDQEARRVVFSAAGREPGSDPYLAELYAVSLDGGELETLTSDGLDHDALPSPSGACFVDVMSAVDVPAISVLRDRSGAVVLELERADATALYAAGWQPAERVKVKAADGVTDIWCAIYKPHDFDPNRRYPVVDEVYPGPQISTAARRFPLSGGGMTGERNGASFAALGFAVVAVDGRGSALRSRSFQDHARLVSDTDFVDDHVAAIRQLAETRPWLDLDRVGIFGHSAGAYASTRALLWAPDFFKVAVSSSGDHDDRINHAWWGEKFFGLADEFDYERHANNALVERLKGKLFLVHGEMDDNATPHGTLRLVDALIRANKDFDLLIVPNAEHSLFVNAAYWLRRRWDYFVQHLLGETPPEYRIADLPYVPPGS